MEEITGFGMKDCLPLPGLGWKYSNSLKAEEDEPIYTHNDKYKRWFVKGGLKEDEYVLLIKNISQKFVMIY